MFQPNYNNRHTFFISSSVVLIIFGLYPFYIINNLKELSLKIIIFHLIIIFIGVVLFIKGTRLWKERDKDREDIIKFLKEEMKRTNELKKLEIEMNKLRIDKDKLSFDRNLILKEIEESKREKSKVDKENEKKIEENKKLSDEIIKKEKELLEKERELYNKRDKSINELPSTMNIVTATGFMGSGTASSEFIWTKTGILAGLSPCKKCGALYTPLSPFYDEGLCENCKKSPITFSGVRY